MELDTRNCWTLAEALGHRGPHRLQHFLSRAVVHHDRARDRITARAAAQLGDPDAVLIVDRTGDEKSSTDCVGVARQYSGALAGIGLCQIAVHLTYASRHGHAPDQPAPLPRCRVGRRRGTAPAHRCPRRRHVRHQTPDRLHPARPRPRPGHTGTVAGRRRSLRRQGNCGTAPAHSASTTPWPSAPITVGHRRRPPDRHRPRSPGPEEELNAPAHRPRPQGRPSLRLGHARHPTRRHPRRTPAWARHCPGPPSPLHPRSLLLPMPMPPLWAILWMWCAAGGASRRTSRPPRASAASTRARPPAGTPGCAGL